jgi:hypothetical protein
MCFFYRFLSPECEIPMSQTKGWEIWLSHPLVPRIRFGYFLGLGLPFFSGLRIGCISITSFFKDCLEVFAIISNM